MHRIGRTGRAGRAGAAVPRLKRGLGSPRWGLGNGRKRLRRIAMHSLGSCASTRLAVISWRPALQQQSRASPTSRVSNNSRNICCAIEGQAPAKELASMQILSEICCALHVHLLHSMPSGHIFPCTGGRLGHAVCRHPHASAFQGFALWISVRVGCTQRQFSGYMKQPPYPPFTTWQAHSLYVRLQSRHTIASMNLVGTSTHLSILGPLASGTKFTQGAKFM